MYEQIKHPGLAVSRRVSPHPLPQYGVLGNGESQIQALLWALKSHTKGDTLVECSEWRVSGNSIRLASSNPSA